MHHLSFTRSHSWSHAAFIAGAALAFGACSSNAPEDGEAAKPLVAITSQGAALTAIKNTEAALNGVLDAGEFLAESVSIAQTLNALTGPRVCEILPEDCAQATGDCAPGESQACTPEQIKRKAHEVRDEIREEVRELVARLREEIFIPANVDDAATTDTQVTYRLGPDLFCGPPSSDDDGLEQGLSKCAENINKLNLRIRLTQPNENDVDATFIVDNPSRELGTVQLYEDRLGAKLNLAEVWKTLPNFSRDFDDSASLEGIVQFQFIKNQPLDYSLILTVLEDVVFSATDAPDRFLWTYGKADRAVELNLNANTQTLSASYNYRNINVKIPLSNVVSSSEELTGVLDFVLPGYTGTASFTADNDEIHISGAGLVGPFTVTHEGNLLASFDVNPEHDRAFDLVLTASDDGTSMLVSIDPTIDATLDLHLEHIADQVDVDERFLNERLHMWFEGATPTISIEDNQVRLVSGSLHFTSQSSPDSDIDVAEGMCLVQIEDEDPAWLDSAPNEEELPVPEPVEESSIFSFRAAECQ